MPMATAPGCRLPRPRDADGHGPMLVAPPRSGRLGHARLQLLDRQLESVGDRVVEAHRRALAGVALELRGVEAHTDMRPDLLLDPAVTEVGDPGARGRRQGASGAPESGRAGRIVLGEGQ